MDALGVFMMGAGAYLVYAAVKDEHPWTMFQSLLGSTQASKQTPNGPVKVH